MKPLKAVNFRRQKFSYGILGGAWTLVLAASLVVNGGTSEEHAFRTSLLTHAVVWITALTGIFYNYIKMTRALRYREKLARKLEMSIKSTEELIDAVPFGVVIIGKDKIVRKANIEAGRVLGREAGDIVGHVCHQNICPALVGQCPILDNNQTVDRSEKDAVGANGESIPVYKTVIPFNWQGEDVLLEAFVDISERKMHEREMENSLADLQRFNRLATGRELRMIELKAEVNSLLQNQGDSPRYNIVSEPSPDEITPAVAVGE